MTITVKAVNDAPGASDDTYETNEDTELKVAAPGVLGNDGDVDGDKLSAIEVSKPANGTLTLNADGSFTYLPKGDFNGTDSFTYKVNDGTAESASAATVTITVKAVNDAPTIDVSNASASAQYSDSITSFSVSASDVEDPASALTFTVTGLPAGLSLVDNGNGTATVSGRVLVPAGTYNPAFQVSDRLGGSTSAKGAIVVTKEEAELEYTGDTLKSTGSTASNSTTTVSLSAAVREAADGSLGDKLDTTQVRFTVSKSTGGEAASCTAQVKVTASQPGAGSATCSPTTPLGADNYTVKSELVDTGGYYHAPMETAALTVTVAGTGFTTGGGWITEPKLRSRSNFGFTVKYLKNGNIQGNSLYIHRKTVGANEVVNSTGGFLPAGEYNWIIKSNAWATGGLIQKCNTATPKVCTAEFSGKANIRAVNRATGVEYSLGGNYSFQVKVTDNREPGSSSTLPADTYTIRVWDESGTYYELAPAELPIEGGNIQVKP